MHNPFSCTVIDLSLDSQLKRVLAADKWDLDGHKSLVLQICDAAAVRHVRDLTTCYLSKDGLHDSNQNAANAGVAFARCRHHHRVAPRAPLRRSAPVHHHRECACVWMVAVGVCGVGASADERP